MPSLERCRAEIEALHQFFEDWYAGIVDRAGFERMDRALAPEFEMVTPDGERLARSSVISGVRDSYDRNEPEAFAIDIRNVVMIAAWAEYTTVRYEEWQHDAGETTGRISTVLFQKAPSAPGDLIWLDLHETWIERAT